MFATWRTRAVLTRTMVLTAGLSLTASLAGCHSAPPKDHLVAATPGVSAGRPTPATGTASPATGAATGTASPATGTAPPAIGAGCPAAPYGARLYAPGTAKTVALTFDDGPGRSTAAILAILATYQVPATFFNVGVAMATRPWLVREEAQAGYAIGNHTWNHRDMIPLSVAQQAAELDQASAEQWSLAGTMPCAFRPPFGKYDSTTLRLAQQSRMDVWMWSVDTLDWMAGDSDSSYWVQRIIRLAEQGGSQAHPVILMHDGRGGDPATVTALPAIIQFYLSHGYLFVTL
jgi:peptidoglycan/xylan/chitin deacetylase (PgdA/CDA1 family)